MMSTKKQNKIFVFVITVVSGAILLFALRGLLSAVLGTVVMYVLFRPLLHWMVANKGIHKVVATVVVLFTSFVVVVLPIGVLVSMVVSKIQSIVKNPEEVVALFDQASQVLNYFIPQPAELQRFLQDAQQTGVKYLSEIVGSSLNAIFQIVIMYFLLYFMCVDYLKFESAMLRYSPFNKKNAFLFAEEFRNSTYSNVLGQALIAVIQGLLLMLGFLIFSIPDPVFWGVVTIFLSFIPLIGSPLVFIPGAMYAYYTGNQYGAIGILIYGFVLITNIDNVIRLLIAKKLSNTHPIITVVGVIIGLPLFGFLGLVYGPLLFSFFILLVRIYGGYSKHGKNKKV